MSLCNVTGVLRGSDGELLADARVIYARKKLDAIAGDVIFPSKVEADTNAQGEIDMDLVPGNYVVTIVNAGRKREIEARVPQQAAIDITATFGKPELPFANVVILDDISQLPAPEDQKIGVIYVVKAQP